MQFLDLQSQSELVRLAAYDTDTRQLFLTYHSGPTTISYCDVAPDLFDQLHRSPYPDAVIRFQVQARHSFRREAKVLRRPRPELVD